MIEENNHRSPFNYLTLADVEEMIAILTEWEKQKEDGEPLPPFSTRFGGRLESILAQVEAEFYGTPLFPDLTSKAARLFYGIAGQHPFMNGNKRAAVFILVQFLEKNSHQIPKPNAQLLIDFDVLFEMAIRVAKAAAEQENEIMHYLTEKINGMFVDSPDFDE